MKKDIIDIEENVDQLIKKLNEMSISLNIFLTY